MGAAPAQADDLKREAVQDFKAFYRKNKEVSERVEAVLTLKGNECVPAAAELLKLLGDKNEKIRVAAMTVISTYKEIETFRPWIDELPNTRNNKRRALIVEVLGRCGIQQCLPGKESCRKMMYGTLFNILSGPPKIKLNLFYSI